MTRNTQYSEEGNRITEETQTYTVRSRRITQQRRRQKTVIKRKRIA